MTQEIIDGNKLIADFLGNEKIFGSISDDQRQYHTSWDWLMPVVEKIESLYSGSLMVFIKDVRCHIEMGTQHGITKEGSEIDIPECYSGFCNSKIEAVYKSVVHFITWYNNQ